MKRSVEHSPIPAMCRILIGSTIIACSVPRTVDGQALAQKLSDHVDKFTGDFQYSVPLLEVSGPNGESVPLVANYRGGIRVDQDAGWVGLGWDLSIGEIRRTVNGYPDDWNNKKYDHVELSQGTSEYIDAFGPVHFNEIPPGGTTNGRDGMDIYQSQRRVQYGQYMFEFPDYDEYAVSGPGIAGSIEPHLFEFAHIYPIRYPYNSSDRFGTGEPDFVPFTKKPSFSFSGAGSGTTKVNAPYYSETDYDQSCQCYHGPDGYTHTNSYFQLNRDPDHEPTSHHSSIILGALVTPEEMNTAIPPHFPNGRKTWGDIVHGSSRSTRKGSYHVEYFFNHEIEEHFNGTTPITGYLEHEQVSTTSDRDDQTRYDLDGIGAFRITAPNGMTYHYSLPVYAQNEVISTFDVTHTTSNGYGPHSAGPFDQYLKEAKYAEAWKLTAITGPDFVDNGDSYPDEQDEGYWIRYDYSRWTTFAPERYPVYGFQKDLVNRHAHREYQRNLQWMPEPQYGSKGTSIYVEREQVYLDKVVTATQTAVFVKDVRLDGHSAKTDNSVFVPKLRLRHILLFDNRDMGAWFNDNSPLTSLDFPVLGSSTETRTNNESIIHIEQFESDRSVIEPLVLKAVSFEQDFRLAKGLHNNIRSGYAHQYVSPEFYTAHSEDIYPLKPVVTNPAGDPESGKLCLNRLIHTENGMVQIRPPLEFSYVEDKQIDQVLDPLDHDPDRKDHFGYFKSDHDPQSNGGYTTTASAEHVDAWSMNKIITPLGAEIHIEYEADRYSGVGHNDEFPFPMAAERFFFVKDVIDPNSGVLELYDKDGAAGVEEPGAGVELYYWNSNTSPEEQFVPVTGIGLGTSGGSAYQVDVSIGVPSNGASMVDAYLRVKYNEVPGGGTRVKKISVHEPGVQGISYGSSYEYANGVCTHEPDPYAHDGPHIHPAYDASGIVVDNDRYVFSNLSGGDRHAPATMVGYSKIQETPEDDQGRSDGHTTYTFNNYWDFTDLHQVSGMVGNWDVNTVVKATDDRSRYGTPLSVDVFDAAGNNIKKVKYKYCDDPANTSYVDEIFYSHFRTPVTNHPNRHIRTVYYKRKVHRHLCEVSTHENEHVVKQTFLQRDPLTGTPTAVKTSAPARSKQANRALAYQTYNELGPRIEDPTAKNMLTPVVSESDEVHNGGYSTWSKDHWIREFDPQQQEFMTTSKTTLWSPSAFYTYNGETDPTLWEYTGETTLHNKFNVPIESKGIGDRYQATKLGYGDRFRIAEAGNCNHASFTYCGFESKEGFNAGGATIHFFDGEVRTPASPQVEQELENATIEAHSGRYVAKVQAGSQGPTFSSAVQVATSNQGTIQQGLLAGRTYRALVWVHDSSPDEATLTASINGNYSVSSAVQKGDPDNVVIENWVRLEVTLVVPEDFSHSGSGSGLTVELSNTAGATSAFFDDLMVYPIDATVHGYVWDDRRGLVTHEVNSEGLVTYYEHDPGGNVVKVYQTTLSGKKLVQATTVGYARPIN